MINIELGCQNLAAEISSDFNLILIKNENFLLNFIPK